MYSGKALELDWSKQQTEKWILLESRLLFLGNDPEFKIVTDLLSAGKPQSL
jgi:hypothetical protein